MWCSVSSHVMQVQLHVTHPPLPPQTINEKIIDFISWMFVKLDLFKYVNILNPLFMHFISLVIVINSLKGFLSWITLLILFLNNQNNLVQAFEKFLTSHPVKVPLKDHVSIQEIQMFFKNTKFYSCNIIHFHQHFLWNDLNIYRLYLFYWINLWNFLKIIYVICFI